MRTSNFLAAATLIAAVAFTSCNVNDDINATGNETVRFTAGIDQQAVANSPDGTRAAGTAWEANDAIGIFMTEVATTHYANSRYTTTGNGTFTAVAGSEMYYPQNGNTVTFTAYYPYESGAALATSIDVEIATDQTVTDIQPTFDLLYTTTPVTGSKAAATGAVALSFDHKLAKIVMNVKADASVTAPLTGMTVKITGMYTKNTFDLSTGTLGNTPTINTAAITPRVITTANNYDASYDAIIMPGSYAANVLTVEFTLENGDVHTWSLTAAHADFTDGNEYTYAVTLTKHGVKLEGCTITVWVTGSNDRGNVEAD